MGSCSQWQMTEEEAQWATWQAMMTGSMDGALIDGDRRAQLCSLISTQGGHIQQYRS